MSAANTYPRNDDTIEIRVITLEDRQRILDFMNLYFFPDEPLTIGSEPKEEVAYGEDIMLSYIEHGTSLMAVIKETDELVGLTITGPLDPQAIKNIYQDAAKEGETKLVKILRLMARIEQDADVFARYNVDKVLYIIATCVKTEMRGKNVGARLYNAVNALGKQRGFELLMSDCTSFYSSRIKERLNWDCVNTVYYREYLGEDGKPVFDPPPPHECCKSYAIRL